MPTLATIWSPVFVELLPGPLQPIVFLPIVLFFLGAIVFFTIVSVAQEASACVAG